MPRPGELSKDRLHRSIRISEEHTASYAHEDPPEPLQNRLALQVALKLLRSMRALTVALNGQSTTIALYDEIDSVSTYWPLWPHSVAGRHKALQNELLKFGLRLPPAFFHCPQQCLRIPRVLY